MNQINNSNQQTIIQSNDEISYRLAQKQFFCHKCQKNFRRMVNLIALEDISCPTCNEYFCEEVPLQANAPEHPQNIYRQSTLPQNYSVQQSQQSNEQQQRQAISQNSRREQLAAPDEMISQNQILSNLIQSSPLQASQNQLNNNQQLPDASQGENQNIRIVRTTFTDTFGNQTIVEDRYRGNATQPFQTYTYNIIVDPIGHELIRQNQQQRPQAQNSQQSRVQGSNQEPQRTHRVLIFNQAPQVVQQAQPILLIVGEEMFSTHFNQNFRSNLDDQILNFIIRYSEQERGRQGTPPASKDAINNLQEVQVDANYCKYDEETGNLEQPRCAICQEDLTEKAILMPCGHLFNNDCIKEWLNQHNQCPVCRYELPTDDPDYERQKSSTAQQENQNAQHDSLQ